MAGSLIAGRPSDWLDVQLEDVCELRAGANTPADSGGQVAVIKPRNLGYGRIVGTPDLIDEEAAAALRPYRLAAGDIVCVRTGGLGRHAMTDTNHEGWIFGTGIIRLRLDKMVYPLYFNHYLSHPSVQDWLERNAIGTAVPSISTKVLGKLPVSLPPLDRQMAIGETLGALDEKIVLHERIAQTTRDLQSTLLPLLMSGATAVHRV